MNVYLYSFFLLAASCTGSYLESSLSEPPISKQRQRIAHLQKKLQMAEKEQRKVEEEVGRLSEEVAMAKLSLISKIVNDLEVEIRRDPKKWIHGQRGELFLKEREGLYELIQDSPYSFEAQLMLDKILQIITELGDHQLSL